MKHVGQIPDRGLNGQHAGDRSCRVLQEKSFYAEEVKAWKDACMNANGSVAKEASKLSKDLKAAERESRKLQKELSRKEKALAEAAALLVLRKKANAIWGNQRANDQRPGTPRGNQAGQ